MPKTAQSVSTVRGDARAPTTSRGAVNKPDAESDTSGTVYVNVHPDELAGYGAIEETPEDAPPDSLPPGSPSP